MKIKNSILRIPTKYYRFFSKLSSQLTPLKSICWKRLPQLLIWWINSLWTINILKLRIMKSQVSKNSSMKFWTNANRMKRKKKLTKIAQLRNNCKHLLRKPKEKFNSLKIWSLIMTKSRQDKSVLKNWKTNSWKNNSEIFLMIGVKLWNSNIF